MSLDHLWAAWRSRYVAGAGAASQDADGDCVFCAILASGEPDERTHIVWRGRTCVAILNAYPYTSGHLMVMPIRHESELEDLAVDEAAELWPTVTTAVRAIKAAYAPDGLNLGANLGQAGGAGIPGHVHVHVLPRWGGDTNFMTSVAGVRVMPESLDDAWRKLTAAWPAT